MNKTDLVDKLRERHPNLAHAKLRAVVDDVFDVIIREVAHGGYVGVTGLGTFERVARASRTGRNPHTGAAVPIPATAVPKFRPSPEWRGYVADPSSLPTDRPASVRRPATR